MLLQWSTDNMAVCGTQDLKIKSQHWQLVCCYINHCNIKPWPGLHTVTAVSWST